ncbi:hypothetical protein [Bacillus sp. JJ1764]|uniref:hypothetical protein n=1 Tax=Bacillus sp. JJ1764 TaxID=3122964 RepID=UPI002FFFD8DC
MSKQASKPPNLYYFNEYKKDKPFYKRPMKIRVDDAATNTYFMVKNLVFQNKQILALKTMKDPNTIVLVEAKIEDGQLKHISMIPEPFLQEVSRLVELNM